MDVLQDAGDLHKKTFLNHVFSTTEEGKAEILNAVQYAILGVIPIVALNKSVQQFIPEADTEKSSIELLVEVVLQLIAMFCGIIIIHRIITYIPTYSGYKYEHLTITNAILAFLVIVLSIQTKLGIKVNILFDRVKDLWNGTSSDEKKANVKSSLRVSNPMSSAHAPSQADHLDNGHVQSTVFPPAPVATNKPSSGSGYDNMMKATGPASHAQNDYMGYSGPMAANSVLGGSFGSFF